ncbi:MAG TPA: hypothetical protein VMV09_09250 [Candidatus Saccharimonadales bacterium]|nr:hypothetical protein [Candidatus Saccharimonadales bacterium]
MATDHVKEVAEERLDRGRELLVAAKVMLDGPDGEEAEPVLRESLASFRGAMDWFEAAGMDEDFERAHSELHEAGRLVRTRFGCQLDQQGSSYFITCPADLAHVRVGLSPAFVARRIECTTCGQDVAVCPHIKGRTYDGVRCAHRLMELEVEEVSLVAYPAQPDARIVKQSLDLQELAQSLGAEFVPGTPVSCDKCLLPCGGVRRPWG